MAIPGNLLNAVTESMDPSIVGWTGRLNCTRARGTGGRNGDGTLILTSVASGEMQAQSASTVPVAAGELYFVFADASSAAQPERIGIEWLTAALVPVGSITWSMTTSTASATWHRVSVAGECPAGASLARVILSSTTAGASATHAWENVYFGPPIRTSGNLFSFNVESGGEVSTGGWTAETNATVGRSVPVVSWPAEWYLSGGHVIAMTATAGGDAAMEASEMPTAEAGREYLAYCYLNPPTSTADCWVEIRFYDAADTLISATRAYLDQPAGTWFRQRVSGVAPAGTARCGIAAGITAATAGQILRVEGVVMTLAPAFQAGSVVPYSDASFEQGVGTWTVASGAATIARSQWQLTSADGSYYLIVSSATATTSVIRSGLHPVGAAAGLTWRWQVWAQVAAGSWDITRTTRWYDDTATEVGVTSGSTSPAPTPGWWILTTDDEAPAGATQAAIEYTLTATAASSVIWLDRISLWQALPFAEAEPVPELGMIRLTLREMTAGQLMTLWRLTPGGIRQLVRGPSGLLTAWPVTSDVMVIEDYEAPIGVPVSYWGDFVSATTGASLGNREAGPVTISVTDRRLMWIKDVGQPQRNLRVVAVTAPDWSRAPRQEEHRVIGRRNPVVLSDVRDGVAGDMQVRTLTDEARRQLHFALDPDHVMLMQWAPGLGLEDIYVKVGDAVEAREQGYGGDPRRTWTLALRQVDQPTGGIAGTAGWTVQDVATEYATVQALIDTYVTVLDLLLDERR